MDKIFLHHINGGVWSFKDFEAAYKALGRAFIRDYVGKQYHFLYTETYFEKGWKSRSVEGHAHYIMRDDAGNVITFEDFSFILEKESRAFRHSWENRVIRRNTGPVEGVGIFRRCKTYRHPKTLQERRNSQEDDDIFEYNVKIRAKRNAVNLPSYYDDVPRSDRGARNWKHYRTKQYKGA